MPQPHATTAPEVPKSFSGLCRPSHTWYTHTHAHMAFTHMTYTLIHTHSHTGTHTHMTYTNMACTHTYTHMCTKMNHFLREWQDRHLLPVIPEPNTWQAGPIGSPVEGQPAGHSNKLEILMWSQPWTRQLKGRCHFDPQCRGVESSLIRKACVWLYSRSWWHGSFTPEDQEAERITLKAHLQCHGVAPPTGNHVLKHRSLWGHFTFSSQSEAEAGSCRLCVKALPCSDE